MSGEVGEDEEVCSGRRGGRSGRADETKGVKGGVCEEGAGDDRAGTGNSYTRPITLNVLGVLPLLHS